MAGARPETSGKRAGLQTCPVRLRKDFTMALNVPELIRAKRQGQALDPASLKEFIDGYVAGQVPDYQVAAFLMAVFFRGMTPEESAALTRSMVESGEQYRLEGIEGPKVDKHSTGGVGDKVSLVLVPLVASAHAIVPKVSGRGLGHTGGTLDKLSSIPGFRWELGREEFLNVLRKAGCAIIGQTDSFVPADKRLYALRDVTATVDSIPLICSSILSKKVAAGMESLVMDVKVGSGAFLEEDEEARALAAALVEVGAALGKKVSAVITQMGQPLGHAVGNALEMREALDVLRGEGPSDVRDVVLRIGGEMLLLAGLAEDAEAGRAELAKRLGDGSALEKFRQWVEAQGGDPRVADDPDMLEVSGETAVVEAREGGYIQSIATRDFGVAANLLGAGRAKLGDDADLAVGLAVHRKVGDRVEKGDPLVTIYHRGGRSLKEAETILRGGIVAGPEKPPPLPLFPVTL